MGGRFGFKNKFAGKKRFFDYVISVLNSGLFTNETADAKSAATADVAFSATTIGDAEYFGMKTTKFGHVRLILSTAQVGGTRVLEYWNGAAWTALTSIILRGSLNLTTEFVHDIVWSVPANWAKTSITGSGFNAYWVRLRVTATGTAPVGSQIYNLTIIDSTAEIPLLGLNAGLPSPSDEWRTANEYTIEFTSGFYQLSYSDGSTRNVSFTWGKYRPAEAAAHMQSVMNTLTPTAFCEFSEETGFKFGRTDAGTFQLLGATGTTKANSVLPGLGFDVGADKTGATSYTADYFRRSSGGNFLIGSTNDNLIWTGTAAENINLPNGRYNASSLQSMLKSQMDTAAAETNYDVRFFEESGLWYVDHSGASFTISSCEFITASVTAWPTGTATSFTGTAVRLHTEEWLVFATDALFDCDAVAFMKHNLTSSGTYKLQKHNGAGGWTDVVTFTWNANALISFLSSQNQSLWRFLVVDKDNPDLTIRVGQALAFDFDDGYFEMSVLELQETDYGNIIIEDKSLSSGGVKTGTFISEGDEQTTGFQFITATDRSNLEAMQKELGTIAPFLYIPNKDAVDVASKVIWASLSGLIRFRQVDSGIEAYDAANVPMEEFL
ncbi:hypothetical protein L0152_07190 [bacterium]|nr:hypothetical protein [bacterium]